MKLGKHWVDHVALSDDPESWLAAVNEISAGSCCKYKLDKTTGQLELARALPRDVVYPANYGFIPHTRSDSDDEETDILVLTAEPLLPLTIVRVRLIGGFSELAESDDVPDDRMLAVAIADPNVSQMKSLQDVDAALKRQLEQFVASYKSDEGEAVTFEGWFDREEALARYKRAHKRAKKRPAK